MKTKDLIKYFLSCGALIYTVGSVLILAISLAASESTAASILAPKPFLFFLGFSYFISLGNTLYKTGGISQPVRRLLHALCYVIGFFAFVLLCGVDFAFSAIFSAVFAAIYAIVIFTSAVIRNQMGRTRKPKNASVPERPEKKSKKPTKSKKTAENTYQSRFS